jgi:hypothetical protein
VKEIEKRRSRRTPPTAVRVPPKAIITDLFSVLVVYISFGFCFGKRAGFSLCTSVEFLNQRGEKMDKKKEEGEVGDPKEGGEARSGLGFGTRKKISTVFNQPGVGFVLLPAGQKKPPDSNEWQKKGESIFLPRNRWVQRHKEYRTRSLI